MLTLWKSLVLPILEYCSVLWSSNVNNAMSSYNHGRYGRKCRIPQNRNLSVRLSNIREACLPIFGSKLLNVLPKNIRNLTVISVDSFKNALDKFLIIIPDEPQLPGYMKMRRASSNSIIQMNNFGDPAFQVTNSGRVLEHSPWQSVESN